MVQRGGSSNRVADLDSRRTRADRVRQKARYHLVCGLNEAVLVCCGDLDAGERVHFDAVLRRLERLPAKVVLVLAEVGAADPDTLALVLDSKRRRANAGLPPIDVGNCSAPAHRALARAMAPGRRRPRHGHGHAAAALSSGA